MVTFVLGYLFTFEKALISNGYPVRHIEPDRKVPIFKTLPVGLNLYVVQATRKGGSMGEVTVRAIPFVIAMLGMVAALITFPEIALFLP